MKLSSLLTCILLTVLCGSAAFAAPQEIYLEASDATLSNVTLQTDRAGYSGKGYAANFSDPNAAIQWAVPNAQAGLYLVKIRCCVPSGPKGYDLVVDGHTFSGMFTGTGTVFATQDGPEVELTAGANTIAIHRGWGYYEINALHLVPAPPPPALVKPSAKLSDPAATPQARKLMKFLVQTYGSDTLSGQHGIGDADYIQSVIGTRPAIQGSDLIEYSPTRLSHGSKPNDETEKMIQAAKSGQIVTMVWHWNAPMDLIDSQAEPWWKGFYTEGTTFNVQQALDNPDSPEYKAMIGDLDTISVQLEKFQAAGVPVLWRPLHEAEGGWFWWGAKGPEPFKKLWRLMHHQFVDVHHLHNLIWVDCAGTNPDWYPGDDVVDIIGIDAYPTDPSDPLTPTWDTLIKEYGGRKLLALTEFGKVPDVAKMRRYGVRWAYFMSWTGNLGAHGVDPEELKRLYAAPTLINANGLTARMAGEGPCKSLEAEKPVTMNRIQTVSTEEAADLPPQQAKRPGVTARALIVGLAMSLLVDLWIEYAELIMGGRQGHSALAITAVPVGPFTVLFVLTAINLLCRGLLPSLAFTKTEMLTVYVMMTTSCVLSSSGQLQFLIPALTAPYHYATPENGWASLFHAYIPDWMAQKDPAVLQGFYLGKSHVPVLKWLPQIVPWCGFMLALAGASLCTVAILRRQWVERERLSFPTVALPLALINDTQGSIFKNPLFWGGTILPFGIIVLNTVSLNVPGVPILNMRSNPVFQTVLTTPPWNAINDTAISFYPFVIGIAYFAPLDVSFSCWFFYLMTRVELVFGSASGLSSGAVQGDHAVFPFIGHQGAGAFIGLTLSSLYLARGYLKEVFLKAIGRNDALDDSQEPIPYRLAFIGLIACLAFMVTFCAIGGMNPLLALLVIVLGLIYMIAATRIRAETGDAWLSGPDVDVGTLVTRTFGGNLLHAPDLTVVSFLRTIIANGDLRCITMPHQLESFKMAQETGASQRSLVKAVVIATCLGLSASFFIALFFWHAYGAEVGTEFWRTSQGRLPFDTLANLLKNKPSPDGPGIGAVGFGIVFTALLITLRNKFIWWPLHPVGYAIANTYTMHLTWLPFLLAWMFKSLVMRYGGAKFYRTTQPFFLGMIAGDLFGGGFMTAFGAFTGINVYPMDW